jgi:uncharacterized protein (TIGR02147 family)
MKSENILIFDYTDYAQYLRDFFAEQKELNPHASYQMIAEKLGLKHKVQVFRILNGERKGLPKSLIEKFSELCQHSKRESEYFNHLIAFNEAKTLDQKNKFYEAMHKVIRPVHKYQLRSHQLDYLSEYYIPVIRELICMPSFKGDLNALAKQIRPAVTVAQVEKAIKVLLALGLVEASGQGFIQKNISVKPAQDLKDYAIKKFQRQHLDIASQMIDQLQTGEFKSTTATFGTSQAGAALIRQEMISFHHKITDLMASFNNDMDRVYQFNMQLYPLSGSEQNEDK